MSNINLVEIGYKFGLYFVPFLFALCFHEYAHGWVARRKGDRTAELMGRLTMNPVSHIDMLGTVLLPLTAIFTGLPFFGWAKPVPVNPRNLARPKQDMFWIAFAGPLSNVLLALIATLVLGVVLANLPIFGGSKSLLAGIQVFIMINLYLAFFNMLPLHPLDGGKVLARFLPDELNRKLEDAQMYTIYILLALILLGGLQYLAMPVQIMLRYLIGVAEQISLLLI